MLFPDSAKKQIAKSFYDKTIEVLAKEETLDEEGGLVEGSFTTKSTFKANVRFNALGTLQSELGLTENIDIAISCDTKTNVKVGDILRYADLIYIVTDALPRDSHKFIMGKKWRVV